MKKAITNIMILIFLSLLSSACGRNSSVCPPTTGTPEPTLDILEVAAQIATPGPSPTPAHVEIKGKMVLVDRVVSGPVCNATWHGKIYFGCNTQVLPWDEEEGPLFFKDCDLQISPGTIIYVAYHNDQAYYKGCSCHTGELAEEY